jgi:hypothetical protein
MIMKTYLVLLFVPVIALAGKNALTGNVRLDLLSIAQQDTVPQSKSIMEHTAHSDLKSPLMGGMLSLLVPGAGEYYSERYVKSGIFFALEVAVVTTAIVYNSKGNKKTDEFQNYADQHWSVVDYARWIINNGAHYEISGVTYPTITVDPNGSLPPWQRVNFDEINKWEAAPHTTGFSHQLPPYGDQQYYELIGKYSQFKYGWDTYVGKDGTRYGDDGYDVNFIPQQVTNYAANRGKANDYFYAAEIATALIVANHVLSALDGVWSSSNYNKEITSEMGFRLQDIGGGEMTVATQLTVKVRL